MKVFCPRLILSILIIISLGFIFTTKAQAKAPYGFTWDIRATSSAIQVTKTATDSANDIFYAGTVAGNVAVAFDPTDGVSDVITATNAAIFVTKINSDGTYGFTHVYDGASSISLKSLKTDANGNIYISGIFQGLVNFDPVGSTDIIDSGTDNWSFLTKIDTSGNYQYTLTWPNPLIQLSDMTIDVSNNIYLGGIVSAATDSAQLDPIGATDNKTLDVNEQMGFYVKLNFDGTYGYSKSFLATSAATFSLDHLTVDANSNVYFTGNFQDTVIFDGSGGTDSKTSNGGLSDIYVSKYDSSGNYVLTYTFGGIDDDYNLALETDRLNNVYLLGRFNGTVDFDPTGGIDNIIAAVADERFLTKINSDETYAQTLVWDSTNSINIFKIAFDANNLIYILGSAPGNIDFDPTVGVDQGTSYGLTDAFMTILNADETYNYTYVWGGTGDEGAYDGSFDSSNNLYIGGYTQSPSVNFDPTGTGTDTKTLWGTSDGFVTKLLTSQTITVSSGNSGSTSSGDNSFTCTNSWPSAPVLFQITAIIDKATLYFAPPADSQNGYTISYGVYNDADMYNVTFPYSDKSGAISYTINSLSPNTTYYYKVRANNGCMPGLWSKTLSAKTPLTGSFTSYYSPTNSFNNGASGQCTQYTVQRGDSLWAIAQKLLTNGRRYLELWNSNLNNYPTLKNSSVIRTGWKLSVGC